MTSLPESAARTLTIVHGPPAMQIPQRIVLGADRIVFGREPGPGGFVLDDLRASRKHTELAFVPATGAYRVKDLESRNGTLINGRKISGAEVLPPNAVLRIGTCLMVCSSRGEATGLVDRREEILPLFRSFLEGDRRPLTTSAAEALLLYDWPMDVRELREVAERARLLAHGERIEPAHLALPNTPRAPAPAEESTADQEMPTLGEDEAPTREVLMKLLQSHGGNVAEVARVTGKHRPQVYRWLRRFGIDLAQFR